MIGFIKKGECLRRRYINVACTLPNGKKVSIKFPRPSLVIYSLSSAIFLGLTIPSALPCEFKSTLSLSVVPILTLGFANKKLADPLPTMAPTRWVFSICLYFLFT